MDTVETLLMCVVSLTVVVFLFVDILDLSKKPRKGCDVVSDSEIEVHQIGSYLLESVKEERGAEKISHYSENPNLANYQGEEADNQSGVGNREEGFDDDWEGIERTELEKLFGEAVVFMSHKSNADKINGDVKLRLYGLEKIALQGPCHGSQPPMALKVSARAKWSAWQKLGDRSPEMAMEKYVNILAEAISE